MSFFQARVQCVAIRKKKTQHHHKQRLKHASHSIVLRWGRVYGKIHLWDQLPLSVVCIGQNISSFFSSEKSCKISISHIIQMGIIYLTAAIYCIQQYARNLLEDKIIVSLTTLKKLLTDICFFFFFKRIISTVSVQYCKHGDCKN